MALASCFLRQVLSEAVMRLLWKVAVLFGALCGTVLAQTSLTSVRGTVTDPSGAVVPGAQIELTNQANATRQTQVAGSQGEYQFQQLVPGAYLLVATAGGFGSQSKRAELLVNQPATVNFRLTVQSEIYGCRLIDEQLSALALGSEAAGCGNEKISAGHELLKLIFALASGYLCLPSCVCLIRKFDLRTGNDSTAGICNCSAN